MAVRTQGGRGGRRPGAGRKPLSVTERQRNRIMLSFTDAEYEKLEAAAEDQPVAAYARSIVLRSLARRRS